MPELEGSWSDWFDRHSPAMLLLARQWTACLADAEDVVQEAFLRFWKRGRDRALDPVAYLFACVKRTALDQRRAATRRSRRELAQPLREAVETPLFTRSLEEDERRQAIESALEQLSSTQREVLVLKIWGGLTFQQIGQALAISPHTAASRYRYALEALQAPLAKEVSS